ncbi:363347be-32eb-4971-8e40-92558dd28158 [Sclerotinia trifoliorum]|uniref:363347be-32eb-4971-8e40-92558dd28158 n=1 Tax=Sclerotinia trifoliorum TaxID=28548 RepID=A0A8H2VZ02_9HELO|nr:363347be-32eb-4971-8e40-92558dd28158 [Sclerotinia trifoliorum]
MAMPLFGGYHGWKARLIFKSQSFIWKYSGSHGGINVAIAGTSIGYNHDLVNLVLPSLIDDDTRTFSDFQSSGQDQQLPGRRSEALLVISWQVDENEMPRDMDHSSDYTIREKRERCQILQ